MKTNQIQRANQELIPISEHDGKQTVSARDLHAFLDPAKGHSNSADFAVLTLIDRLPMLKGQPCELTTWIKNRIRSYGLIENHD